MIYEPIFSEVISVAEAHKSGGREDVEATGKWRPVPLAIETQQVCVTSIASVGREAA